MELIVFDLDGTLLDNRSRISDYTRDTLRMLADRGIAYTVATGRTLHASHEIIEGHQFTLPQIYKNGVMIWNPEQADYSHTNFLTQTEIQHVLEAVLSQGVTPFIFTLEPGNRHAIYHTPLLNEVEQRLAADFAKRSGVEVLAAAQMPAAADITNVSALGSPHQINAVDTMIAGEQGLIAYSGNAMEGSGLNWIDIHHSEASKGGAVGILKAQLGVNRVLCFGDSDNDLSMFELADESYAPENAKAALKNAATAIVGHNDEDGIARFLRQRFNLPDS